MAYLTGLLIVLTVIAGVALLGASEKEAKRIANREQVHAGAEQGSLSLFAGAKALVPNSRSAQQPSGQQLIEQRTACVDAGMAELELASWKRC